MRLLLLAALLLLPIFTGCTSTPDSTHANRDYAQPWLTPDLGMSGIGSTHGGGGGGHHK